MSNTNIDRATEALRSTGLNDMAVTSAINALTADNLITPDLPEPNESDNFMLTWKVDDETSVSSTSDGGVMVMSGNGMFSMYFDMDELHNYAMALLAAAEQSKKKYSLVKQILNQLGNQANSTPAPTAPPTAPAAAYPHDKENEFVTDAMEAAANEPGATEDSIAEARERAEREFFQLWKSGKLRD